MLNVGLAITDCHVLVAAVGFDTTLDSDDLVLEEEFHAQEVFYVDLCLFDLDGGLGFFRGGVGLAHCTVVDVFVVLALETLVYALESHVLFALLTL